MWLHMCRGDVSNKSRSYNSTQSSHAIECIKNVCQLLYNCRPLSLSVCLSPCLCLSLSLSLCLSLSISLSMSPSLFVSVCVSVCLCVSVSLYVCLYVSLSLSVSVSLSLSLSLSASVSVRLCVSVCLSVCLYVCLSLCNCTLANAFSGVRIMCTLYISKFPASVENINRDSPCVNRCTNITYGH